MWERSAGADDNHVMKHSLFMACTLALAGLSTGCDYFEEVTIPPTDTTPPVGAVRLYAADGSVDKLSFGSLPPVQHQTDDLDKTFYLIGAGFDVDGAQRVRLIGRGRALCRLTGTQTSVLRELTLPTKDNEQPGQPGDVVQSGVWDMYSVKLSDVTDLCPSGSEPYHATFSWWGAGWNYAGQSAVHGAGELRWDL